MTKDRMPAKLAACRFQVLFRRDSFVISRSARLVPSAAAELFPDAELPEDHAEQFLRVRAAHDVADGIHRGAQFLRDELR